MAFLPKNDITEYTDQNVLAKELYKEYLRTKDNLYDWKFTAIETFNEVFFRIDQIFSDPSPEDGIKKKYLDATKERFGTRYASTLIYCMVWAYLSLQTIVSEHVLLFLDELERKIKDDESYYPNFARFVGRMCDNYGMVSNRSNLRHTPEPATNNEHSELQEAIEKLKEENERLRNWGDEQEKNYRICKQNAKEKEIYLNEQIASLKEQLRIAQSNTDIQIEAVKKELGGQSAISSLLSFENIIAWCKEQMKYEDVKPVEDMLRELLGFADELPNRKMYLNEMRSIKVHYNDKEQAMLNVAERSANAQELQAIAVTDISKKPVPPTIQTLIMRQINNPGCLTPEERAQLEEVLKLNQQ